MDKSPPKSRRSTTRKASTRKPTTRKSTTVRRSRSTTKRSPSRSPPRSRTPSRSASRSPRRKLTFSESPEEKANDALLASYLTEREEVIGALNNYKAIASTPGLGASEYKDVSYKIQEHEAQLNSLDSRIEETKERGSPAKRAMSLRRSMSSSGEKADMGESMAATGAVMTGIGSALGGMAASLMGAPVQDEKLVEAVVSPKRSPLLTRRSPSPRRRSGSPSLKASSPGSPEREGTVVMRVRLPSGVNPNHLVIRFPSNYTVDRLNQTMSAKFGTEMKAYVGMMSKASPNELVTTVYGTKPTLIRFHKD